MAWFNLWVSAFTLILAYVDFFLLCHFNNAIISLFFSQFNILVIFIGRVFQVIWSIVLPETKVGSSSQREEKDIINYMVSEARRKTIHICFGETQQFLALKSDWDFSQQPFQQAPQFFLWLGWPGMLRQVRHQASELRPLDCQSWVVFSSEEDPRRQMTLSMLCYTQ